MPAQFTIAVLVYGDYPDLAWRCLESLWSRLPAGAPHVADIRIGMNSCSETSRLIVDWFSVRVSESFGIPVAQYDCGTGNACKYPLLRRMASSEERGLAEFLMWFDDDSYLSGGPGWWSTVLQAAESADMLGKLYIQRFRGRQWDWVRGQAWFNAKAGPPEKRRGLPIFRFATGGWWVIRSGILRRWNWPSPELRHTGGDAMLGELLRHQGYRLLEFDRGVQINANKQGVHSTCPGRGASAKRSALGSAGWTPSPDVSFQEFEFVRRTFGGCDVRPASSASVRD